MSELEAILLVYVINTQLMPRISSQDLLHEQTECTQLGHNARYVEWT